MVPIPSGALVTPVNRRSLRGGRCGVRLCCLLALSAAVDPLLSAPLTVVTWNIDRGTEYEKVARTLQRLHPDILLLQEVDIGTERAGRRDIGKNLAAALSLQETYGQEFEELSQEKGQPAFTGQATLSRLPVRRSRVLHFQHQSNFWKPNSWLPSSVPLLQRRLGDRIALITELDYQGELLVIYNLHLESRSYGRLQFQQLDEVLADCAEHYPTQTAVLIGGDLNSKYMASLYLKKLQKAGFHSALGSQIERTHVIAMALDWLFVRGMSWNSGSIDKSSAGSDHFPIRAILSPSAQP